jgi:lysophospholipase L1-like esterase
MWARLVHSVVVVVVACSACRGESLPTQPSQAPDLPAPPALRSSVQPDDPSLRYGGWFDRHDPRAVRFAWPGTRIEAAFDGTSIAATFTDTPTEDATRETDWLEVVIDDGPPRALHLNEGRHEYVLASGLAPAAHSVSIWKRTEPAVGVITFHGFTLSAGSSVGPPLPPRPRRMLFIGDSVTAGYGNEGPNAKCHWSADTENNYATYGAYAARALDAEYVATAWSGKGLTRNYDATDATPLPGLYRRVIPTEETSALTPAGRFDVIVINLGTNDFFQGVPSRRGFFEAYRDFLESLRAQYPDAFFVMQVGPMLADDYPQPHALTRMRYWSKLVRGQRRMARDKRCELLEFWVDRAEGSGCDSHPSVKTHERLGKQLADFVKQQLKW